MSYVLKGQGFALEVRFLEMKNNNEGPLAEPLITIYQALIAFFYPFR